MRTEGYFSEERHVFELRLSTRRDPKKGQMWAGGGLLFSTLAHSLEDGLNRAKPFLAQHPLLETPRKRALHVV